MTNMLFPSRATQCQYLNDSIHRLEIQIRSVLHTFEPCQDRVPAPTEHRSHTPLLTRPESQKPSGYGGVSHGVQVQTLTRRLVGF